MRIFLLFLLSASYLFSQISQTAVKIDSSSTKIKDFNLEYFINDTQKLAFDELEKANFTLGKNRGTLGSGINDVWIKINLINTSKQKQTLFLHEDQAYTFLSKEYFEVDARQQLLHQKKIEPYGENAKEQLNGSDAVYKISLEAQSSKTLYIHQKTPAYHFYNYYIFNEKESIEYLIYEKVDAVLIVGLLMALALYNFLIYISSRYKEYLYYSLYLSTSTIWIFYIYGSLAHYLQFYGVEAFRFNTILSFSPLFLALFIQAVFETKKKYKIEHLFLNSVVVVLFLNFLYSFIDVVAAVALLSKTLNYAMLVFLAISTSIYFKGNKIIGIFLVGHLFYIFFTFYALAYYMGNVEANYISSHGIGIGISIEALILAYLVSYKFKTMQEEKHQAQLNERNLRFLSNTDPMTKLYNRRYFSEISQSIISLCKRKKEPLSLMIIDIDKFKDINDTYGHQVGDEVIVSFAHILRETQRQSDVVCRYGGDEFVVLLPDTSLQAAQIVAEKIRKQVKHSLCIPALKSEVDYSLSIGISEVDIELDTDVESALERADRALYSSKEHGRDKISVEKI